MRTDGRFLAQSLLGILAFAAPGTLGADFSFRLKITQEGVGASEPKTAHYYVSGNRLRIEVPQAKSTLIYRLDRDLLWILDEDVQTYRELSFAEIREMAKEFRARTGVLGERERTMLEGKIARLKEALTDPAYAEIREELQAKIQEFEGRIAEGSGQSKSELKLLDTGTDEKLQGLSCRKWEVRNKGGETVSAWWVNGTVQGADEYVQAEKARTSKVPAATITEEIEYLGFQLIPGFPVKRHTIGADSLTSDQRGFDPTTTSTLQASEFSTAALEPGFFEVPAEYEKRSNP